MEFPERLVVAVGRLVQEKDRRDAARDLAGLLGAVDVLIFIKDPAIHSFLPAPGFSANLPKAMEWHALVRDAAAGGRSRAELPYPDESQRQIAHAVPVGRDGVVIVVGGQPAEDSRAGLPLLLLPLIALFVSEMRVNIANASADQAHASAAQLRAIADSLDEARRLAHRALEERGKAEAARAEKAAELERSNRDLQQFAAIASHDLQEPLRMISSYLSLFQARYRDQIPEQGRVFLGHATSGASRMGTLIRSLLAYAQVGTTQRTHLMVPLEIIMREAMSNLQTRISETGGHVHFSELPSVRGDHVLLVQLMQNLLGNALKFTREGVEPQVRIDAEKSGNRHWKITVADNGIGIAEQHRARIFDVFQRLHTAAEFEGTGIGLATCRRIVDSHDGNIGVTSEVGAGSTFWFTLPDG
jgi:signal transduction histidine kinase